MIENVYARSLCVSADVESVRFGAVGAVVGDMGSVVRGDKVVARKDGKDLWCQHLVCLGAFCEAVVEEFLRREKEREMTRRAGRKKDEERGVRFRRLACREEFEMFWERWCRGRLGTRGEGECGRMKGPYDM